MSSKKQTFLTGLNYQNLGISIKLNLLTYMLLILSFTTITVVIFNLFEKFLKESSYKNLEQIVYQKKSTLEKDYLTFTTSFQNFFTEKIALDIESLNNAYKDYSYHRRECFFDDSLSESKYILQDFYDSEVIDKIEWKKPDIEEIFPTRSIEIVMQYTYIANNKWEVGEKDKLIEVETGSDYATYHKLVQTKFRSFARKFSINNVYLVDLKTGDIFYNLNKNIAFATNLFTGHYKTSELSKVFQETTSSTSRENKLFFSDYNNFVPEYNRPVAFIAQNVRLYNDKIAVAIVEVGPEFWEKMLNDKWLEQNWESTNVNILGKDNLFRINEIEQYIQPDIYQKKINKKSITSDKFLKASALEGAAFALGLSPSLAENGLSEKTAKTFFGDEVHLLQLPLRLNGLNWSIIGYTSSEYHDSLIASWRKILILVYVILLVLATISLRGVVRSMIFRLNKLTKAFVSLSKGEKTELLSTPWQDELGKAMGVFNELNDRVQSASEFAIKLSEGDYSKEFNMISDKDSFAKALNILKESLHKSKEEQLTRIREEEKSNWTNQEIAKFNDLLRKSNNDIKTLAYILLENLIGDLNANQGGIFLIEGETEINKKINLIAGFAYNRKKYNTKSVEISEGLLGSCYKEKKSIHLKKIPDDYIEITSGLGSAVPKSLYIAPLIIDENVLGIMEIASFNEFEQYQIDFIDKLAENFAATFATVKLNTRTAELLEESKKRANEISQQEEEMRQNMEEMQATQEELARLRDEDEKNTKKLKMQIDEYSSMLQNLINTMPGEVIIKDHGNVVVLANEEACDRYKTTVEGIKGMSDAEFMDIAVLEQDHAIDAEVFNVGDYSGYRTEIVNGEQVDYEIEKSVFYLKHSGEPGIMTSWKKVKKQ